ncbi:hypothetical protein ACQB60_10510 [Actinomycetota bacterium Odt1-20B]
MGQRLRPTPRHEHHTIGHLQQRLDLLTEPPHIQDNGPPIPTIPHEHPPPALADQQPHSLATRPTPRNRGHRPYAKRKFTHGPQ